MADISKCYNAKCPVKEGCYRFTARDGYWQLVVNFTPNPETGECEGFWSNERMTESQLKKAKKTFNK